MARAHQTYDIEGIEENSGDQKYRICYTLLKETGRYNAGSSFGELALISSKPRAASVIAKTDGYLAIIEKATF